MKDSKHMRKARRNNFKLLHNIKTFIRYSFKLIELAKFIFEIFH